MQILPRFLGDWDRGMELPKGEGNPGTYLSPPLPLTSPLSQGLQPYACSSNSNKVRYLLWDKVWFSFCTCIIIFFWSSQQPFA